MLTAEEARALDALDIPREDRKVIRHIGRIVGEGSRNIAEVAKGMSISPSRLYDYFSGVIPPLIRIPHLIAAVDTDTAIKLVERICGTREAGLFVSKTPTISAVPSDLQAAKDCAREASKGLTAILDAIDDEEIDDAEAKDIVAHCEEIQRRAQTVIEAIGQRERGVG